MLNYPHISLALGLATPKTCRRRIRSKVRARKLVDVRIALAAILHERGWTYSEIARELNRAQSLVHHYTKAHETLLETNTDYHHLFSTLHHSLKESFTISPTP
jgi:predicted transcriptional regulator